MEDIKTKILQSIPIENYISRFVSLKKQGRYLVGLCPFHKEKTPSFTVTPEKGIFYCFGCGKRWKSYYLCHRKRAGFF
jgi:DNA primase